VERGRSHRQVEGGPGQSGLLKGPAQDLKAGTAQGAGEEFRHARVGLDRDNLRTVSEKPPGHQAGARTDLQDLGSRVKAAPDSQDVVHLLGIIRAAPSVASRIAPVDVTGGIA
jgi:hypothetical protein